MVKSTDMVTLCICVILMTLVATVTGSGTLLIPPSRGVMWKEGFKTETNFNYMQLNCGGIKQKEIGLRQCGVCGDPLAGTRSHELGNRYGTGTIGRYYKAGIRELLVKVELLAFEKGFFEFRICPANDKPVTQECLNQNLLPIKEGYLAGMPMRFYPEKAGEFRLTIAIPPNMTCDRCVIQWRYRTANSWGQDSLSMEEGVGLGPQEEFFNCADIRIGGKVPRSVLNNPFLSTNISGTDKASGTGSLIGVGSTVNSAGGLSARLGDNTGTIVASNDIMALGSTTNPLTYPETTATAFVGETGTGKQDTVPGKDIMIGEIGTQHVKQLPASSNKISFPHISTAMNESPPRVSDNSKLSVTHDSDHTLQFGSDNAGSNDKAGLLVVSSNIDRVGLSSSSHGGGLGSTSFENKFGSAQELGTNPSASLYPKPKITRSEFTENIGDKLVVDSGLSMNIFQETGIQTEQSASIPIGDTSSAKIMSVSHGSGATFGEDISVGTIDNSLYNTSETGPVGIFQDNPRTVTYHEGNIGVNVKPVISGTTGTVSNVAEQNIVVSGFGKDTIGLTNTQNDHSIGFIDTNPRIHGIPLTNTISTVDTNGLDKRVSISFTPADIQTFPMHTSTEKSNSHTMQGAVHPKVAGTQSDSSKVFRETNVEFSRGSTDSHINGVARKGIEMSDPFVNNVQSYPIDSSVDKTTTLTISSGPTKSVKVPETASLLLQDGMTTGLVSGGEVHEAKTFIGISEFHSNNVNVETHLNAGMDENKVLPGTRFIAKIIDSSSPSTLSLSNIETTASTNQLAPSNMKESKPKQPQPTDASLYDSVPLSPGQTGGNIVFKDLSNISFSSFDSGETSSKTKLAVPSSSVTLMKNQKESTIPQMGVKSPSDFNDGKWSVDLLTSDPNFFDTINTDPSLLPSPITRSSNDITVTSNVAAMKGTNQPITVLKDIAMTDQSDATQMIQNNRMIKTGTDATRSKTVENTGLLHDTTQLMQSDGNTGHVEAKLSPAGVKTFIPFEIIDPSTKVTSIENINLQSPTLDMAALDVGPTGTMNVNTFSSLDKTTTIDGELIPNAKQNPSINISVSASSGETAASTEFGIVDHSTMSDPFNHLPAQSLAVIPLEQGNPQFKTNVLSANEVARGNVIDGTVSDPNKIIRGDIDMLTLHSQNEKSTGKEVNIDISPKSRFSADLVVDLRDVKITTGNIDNRLINTPVSGNSKTGNIVREFNSINSSKTAVSFSPEDIQTTSKQEKVSGSIIGSGSSSSSPVFRFVRDPRTGMMSRVPVGRNTNVSTREQDQIRVNSLRAALQRRRQMTEAGRTGMDTARRASTVRGGSLPPEYMIQGAGITDSTGVRFGNFRARSGSDIDRRVQQRRGLGFVPNPFSPFGDPSVRRPIFPFGIERGTVDRRAIGTQTRERARTGRQGVRGGSVTFISARPVRPRDTSDVTGTERRSRASAITSTTDTRDGSAAALRRGIGSDRRAVLTGQSRLSRTDRIGDSGSTTAARTASGIDSRTAVPAVGRDFGMGGVPIVGRGPTMFGRSAGIRAGDMRFAGTSGFDMGGMFRPGMDTGFFPMRPIMPFRTSGTRSFPMTPML